MGWDTMCIEFGVFDGFDSILSFAICYVFLYCM